MPLAFMLTKEDARSRSARTRDLPDKVRQADVLVVAAGRPGLVTGEMLKPGAVVVDVGINVVDGKIVATSTSRRPSRSRRRSRRWARSGWRAAALSHLVHAPPRWTTSAGGRSRRARRYWNEQRERNEPTDAAAARQDSHR